MATTARAHGGSGALLSTLLVIPALACSDEDRPDGSAAGPQAGAGAGGNGGSGAGVAGASAPRAGTGGGSAASAEPDPVTGDEPVDATYGAGRRGCRADGQCGAMSACAGCPPQWKCVAPGGVRPLQCGTPCCVNPAMCPSTQPALTCIDDTNCLRPEAPHCRDRICVPCGENAHCTDPLEPLCIANACRQCNDDSQCGGDNPHCVGNDCRPCLTTAECAQGICVANQCEPECQSDDECLGPSSPRRCGANLRCEAIACTADTQCPPPFTCAGQGVCTHVPCQHDADCHDDAPYCVQGGCFAALGTCYSLTSP